MLHFPLPPAAVLLAWCVGGTLSAQSVPARTLSQPEARLDREWTRVIGVRELSDGRLIVLDGHENVILLVDARLSAGTPIGREGQGPGEYAIPNALIPLPGDSTGVLELSQRGVKVISPAGRLGNLFAPQDGRPCNAAAGTEYRVSVPKVVDQLGRFYSQGTPFRPGANGQMEQTTTVPIERWRKGCGRDTVATLPHRINPALRSVEGGGMMAPMGGVVAFGSRVQWLVAPDGRIAVATPEPYQIEMISPDGTRGSANRVEYTPLRVTEAHKEAWRVEQRRPAVALVVNRNGGSGRQLWTAPAMEPEWPRDLPPFLVDALSMGSDGRLWVQRTTEAGVPPTFDVFDATGRLAQRVTLPVRTRLVGHGRGVVYVVRIDEDDLEYLERFRLAP